MKKTQAEVILGYETKIQFNAIFPSDDWLCIWLCIKFTYL